MKANTESLLGQQDIVVRQFEDVEFVELVDDLSREIKQRNYRVTRINNIDNIHDRKLLNAGTDVNFLHYKIIEFCNLNSCAALISEEQLSGVFMPVRFSVYQSKNSRHIKAAFLKPTAFARLFTNAPLQNIAKELEQDMIAVLDELG
ncbi:DUF302 domain-containing protein [Pseudomonadota bacterium]